MKRSWTDVCDVSLDVLNAMSLGVLDWVPKMTDDEGVE